MNYSKCIPYKEIKKKLDQWNKIAVVSCNSCARECGVGGLRKANELIKTLLEDKYIVKEELVLQYACSEPVYQKVRVRLEADTIIVLACSAGVNCIKRLYPEKKVVQVTEDVGLFITETEMEVFKVIMPFSGFDEGGEYQMYTGDRLANPKLRLVE